VDSSSPRVEISCILIHLIDTYSPSAYVCFLTFLCCLLPSMSISQSIKREIFNSCCQNCQEAILVYTVHYKHLDHYGIGIQYFDINWFWGYFYAGEFMYVCADCRHDWRETFVIPMPRNLYIFLLHLCHLSSKRVTVMWNQADHQVDLLRELLLRCRRLRHTTCWTIVWRRKKVNCYEALAQHGHQAC